MLRPLRQPCGRSSRRLCSSLFRTHPSAHLPRAHSLPRPAFTNACPAALRDPLELSRPAAALGALPAQPMMCPFAPRPPAPFSPRLARLRDGRKEAGAPAVVGFQNHVFKVWGSRLGVGGLGGWGSGFQNLRFRGLGLGLRVTGLWLQVEGSILPRRV